MIQGRSRRAPTVRVPVHLKVKGCLSGGVSANEVAHLARIAVSRVEGLGPLDERAHQVCDQSMQPAGGLVPGPGQLGVATRQQSQHGGVVLDPDRHQHRRPQRGTRLDPSSSMGTDPRESQLRSYGRSHEHPLAPDPGAYAGDKPPRQARTQRHSLDGTAKQAQLSALRGTGWTAGQRLLSGRPQVRVLSRARVSAGQTGYSAGLQGLARSVRCLEAQRIGRRRTGAGRACRRRG